MYHFITRVAIVNLVMLLLLACSKEDEFDFNQHNKVAVITKSTDDVFKNGATLYGRVNTKNGSELQEIGFLYGLKSNLSDGMKLKITSSLDTGEFMLQIDKLTPSTIYYYQAFATNRSGIAYGDINSFTTERGYLPVSKTLNAEQIGRTYATVKGMVKDSGGYSIKRRGVCYSSTNSMPTVTMHYQISNDADSSFSVNLTNLQAGTNYYIRSFMETNLGVGYGDVLTFKTLAPIVASGVTTNRVSNIAMNAATVAGNVANDEGAPISKRGIVYSYSTTSPTLENAQSINLGSGIGAFSGTITNLNVNTTYYVRAYATNAAGTSYGSVESFKTLLPSLPSSLTTYSASSISKNSAYLSGFVSNSGGGTIQSKGIVYSANTSAPTVSNGTIIYGGSGTGSIGNTVYNLSSNTTYYARTFATNEAGTGYGPVVSFRTLGIELPSGITLNGASYITSNSAYVSGYVSNSGSGTITSKGVVYSTHNSSPTIYNDKSVSFGSGSGSMGGSLTNLTSNTTYYVRPYATNEAGTAYGQVIYFKTTSSNSTPTDVSTYSASFNSYNTVTFNGYVGGSGNSTISEKGFVYSTYYSTPTLGNSSKTFTTSSSVGSFSRSVSGLSRNTYYYVRAYATNAYGTTYGSTISFYNY